MQISIVRPRRKGMKRSTLRVNVQDHTRSKIDFEAWQRHHVDPLGRVDFLFLYLI